jgi:hypothetical protein
MYKVLDLISGTTRKQKSLNKIVLHSCIITNFLLILQKHINILGKSTDPLTRHILSALWGVKLQDLAEL